ncbi:MAG: hypothetical protein NVSMB51_04300 [Solirubrobacteraceae bacterium]
MLATFRSVRARLLPHGWLDILRQIALFGCAYFFYRLARGAVDGHAAAAFQHARQLIGVERTLHFFVEPSVQAWASGSHLLMGIASWLYVNAQSSMLIGALLYLYICHNRSFYFVRNMLMIAMAIALVGYVAFPTAPPRFMPEWGFFDSVADFTGVPQDSVPVNAFFNPYAAIPSMHVAFALMLGWPLALLARRRATKLLWAAYPFLITFAVVATANHFIADAILGALTAGVSAYLAAGLARARAVWRFAAAPVAAPAAVRAT